MLVGLRAQPWRASLLLFGVAYVGYVIVGALIVFGTGSVPIDTWARVRNAFYALYSRDPHVGAIGVVLSPIPTLAILPFKSLWPALVTSALWARLAQVPSGPPTSTTRLQAGLGVDALDDQQRQEPGTW
jgi:hypothetical protein